MLQRLGELQSKIINIVAASKSPIILQNVADQLGKTSPTILESLNPLQESMLLRSEQAYTRGPRSIMLSEMGAVYAVSHSEVPYQRIYENHTYLKMPDLFKELEICLHADNLRNSVIHDAAFLMWKHFSPFYKGTIHEEYGKPGPIHAAIRVQIISWLLLQEPRADDIDKEKILSFIENAGFDFKGYLEAITDKVERYGKVVASSKAERSDKTPKRWLKKHQLDMERRGREKLGLSTDDEKGRIGMRRRSSGA